ncbi:unannotated protein [freshwater metagenome]|uniref:Unannotated protein n=1 Tax=freshwater metagenome TaxID=449393 RepID=A0A6J6THM4_9ZZZZ|nr:SHOCT domain-containing protein [Actinomycetota bacterium]
MRREERRGPGLFGVMARTAVVAGTATVVSGSIREKQVEGAQAKQAAAQQQAAAAAPAPAVAPAADSGAMTSEMITQLKQLAELHTQGILTDDEFATQKAKLLGE